LVKISFWLNKRTYSYSTPGRDERVALFAATMHHYAYGLLDYAKVTIGGLGTKE
jgi:hypothetical protein